MSSEPRNRMEVLEELLTSEVRDLLSRIETIRTNWIDSETYMKEEFRAISDNSMSTIRESVSRLEDSAEKLESRADLITEQMEEYIKAYQEDVRNFLEVRVNEVSTQMDVQAALNATEAVKASITREIIPILRTVTDRVIETISELKRTAAHTTTQLKNTRLTPTFLVVFGNITFCLGSLACYLIWFFVNR